MGAAVIPLSVELSAESFPLSIHQPLDCQNKDIEASLELHGDDLLADVDATLPPLGVKLTGYRLVSMATVFAFGTVKTILTYKGHSIAPTTLDWVSGTFIIVRQSCLFTYNSLRYLMRFRRRQGYTGSECTKTQISGSGSSKLTLRPRLVIARCVWSEGVSTPTSCWSCSTDINMNE